MVQGALATQPELFASINSAVAGGDAILAGTTDFEKWMTPPKPKVAPPKPSSDGLPKRGGIEKPSRREAKAAVNDAQRWRSKTRYGDGITSGQHRGGGLLSVAPPKPKRPDWSFHGGYTDPNARNQGTLNSVAPSPPKPSRKPINRKRKYQATST
jgi:hypothetical protein